MGEKSAGAERGSRDLYEVLGVSPTATTAQIRAAFRRLAVEYHPDRNPNDRRAATMFKRVNAAHQVLSDPANRRLYDGLTEPIAHDEPARSDPRNPAPPEPKPRARPASEAGRSKKARHDERPPEASSTPVEREIFRDDAVVVTDQRVTFWGGRDFPFSRLSGARLVKDGPNHFIPLFAAIAVCVVAVLWLAPGNQGRWPYVACFGMVAFVVRYIRTAPRSLIRLQTAPGPEVDVAVSGSPAWTNDVVRAIDEGIALRNPDGYRGRRGPVPMVEGSAQAVTAVALCGGLLLGSFGLRSLFDASPAPTAVLPTAVSTSAPAVESLEPVWTEVDLIEVAVSFPGTPVMKPRTERTTAGTAQLREYTLKRGESVFVASVADVSDAPAGSAQAAADGTINQVLADFRGAEAVGAVVVVTDQKRSMANMHGREVTARIEPIGTLRMISYSRLRRNYRVMTLTTSGDDGLADRMFRSIRATAAGRPPIPRGAAAQPARVVATGAPGGAGSADRTNEQTTPVVRTWQCVDGTLVYGTSAEVCVGHGGVDPKVGAPPGSSASAVPTTPARERSVICNDGTLRAGPNACDDHGGIDRAFARELK